jgi:hypothetical protein
VRAWMFRENVGVDGGGRDGGRRVHGRVMVPRRLGLRADLNATVAMHDGQQ